MPSQMVRAHPELPEPAPFDAGLIGAFLRSKLAGKAPAASTQTSYRLAVTLLARWARANRRPTLDELTRADLEDYVIWMRDVARKRDGAPFSPGYVNNQYRALRSFYTWLVDEEEIADPMAKMTEPKTPKTVVPVLSEKNLETLVRGLEKARPSDFEGRRDAAIILLFFSTGLRVEELTELTLDRVHQDQMRVTVTGKGDRQRVARFDARTSNAIDRYLRVRPKHRFAAESPRLWLPTMHKRRPLTTNGIRHMIRRRATVLGFRLHPHMFRHTFAHTWLVNGGEEGDLMEQMGWVSRDMLTRYGASARSERMQRNYDRVMSRRSS